MLVAGTIVDEKFEVISRLGTGGYGTVYKARQVHLDRVVALKLLDAAQFMDAEARARFDREAKSLSMLQHRGLTTLYGYGTWRNAPYMVMECLNGKTLQQVLDEQGPLSISTSTEIVRQIGEALSTIHANGIVHRDLKPANVMLVDDNGKTSAKIIDFGLVWMNPGVGTDVQKLTEMGETVGTAEYMSPEQCMAKELDARSDLYALGCIYFACLTQRPPFQGDSIIGIMRAHCDEQPARIAKHSADTQLVEDCQSVLDRALEKDPERRYQTAEEMLIDLRKVAKHKSITAVRIDIASTSSKPEKSATKLSALGILTGAAISAVAFLALYKPPAPQLEPARSPAIIHEAHRLDVEGNSALVMPIYRRALVANETDHLLTPADVRDANIRIVHCLLQAERFEDAYNAAVPLVKTMVFNRRAPATEMALANMYASCCLNVKRYEEGLEFIAKMKKDTVPNSVADRDLEVRAAAIYSAMGQYQKALDLLSKYDEKTWSGWPCVALCEAKASAYTGLGNLQKARELMAHGAAMKKEFNLQR